MLLGYGLGDTAAATIGMDPGQGCVPAGITFIQAPRCPDGSLMPACGTSVCPGTAPYVGPVGEVAPTSSITAGFATLMQTQVMGIPVAYLIGGAAVLYFMNRGK